MSQLTDTFTAIANAIRTKRGQSSSVKYKPSQMASGISSINTNEEFITYVLCDSSLFSGASSSLEYYVLISKSQWKAITDTIAQGGSLYNLSVSCTVLITRGSDSISWTGGSSRVGITFNNLIKETVRVRCSKQGSTGQYRIYPPQLSMQSGGTIGAIYTLSAQTNYYVLYKASDTPPILYVV